MAIEDGYQLAHDLNKACEAAAAAGSTNVNIQKVLAGYHNVSAHARRLTCLWIRVRAWLP